MISARYATILFGLILSGLMSLLVSGISTFRAVGLDGGFVAFWLQNWAFSWAVAFPSVLAVAPVTRRIVAAMTAPPATKPTKET